MYLWRKWSEFFEKPSIKSCKKCYAAKYVLPAILVVYIVTNAIDILVA